LRALLPGTDLAASYAPPTAPVGPSLDLASPWAPRPNHLASVVWSDIFGADAARPMDRAEAMSVPAMARARNILCGTVAQIPLRAYTAAEWDAAEADDRRPRPLPTQPSWITQTDGALPAFHRMAWTVDDLVFYGWSCWSLVRGADGYPRRADRIRMGAWSLDDAGRVKLDRGDGVHDLVDQRTVALIPGPHEGLLTFGQSALRHAKDLQTATATAAKDPVAHTVITQTEGEQLTDAEVDHLLDRWITKRRLGGVGFLGRGLKAEELGSIAAHLLESGRNAAAVDIARTASLPADLLDAAAEHSLTYANARDNDARGVQYGSGLYASAVADALSQSGQPGAPGVTPRGTLVRFDVQGWLSNPVPAAQPTTPAQASREVPAP
jgi:hypothetical protein